MWDDTCRWARPRLPLLAGGELTGSDRRKAERHLIGCPECRDRLASFHVSLAAMQGLSEEPLALVNTASLWPALARQIREQRRSAPASWSRPGFWVAVSLAASVFLAVGAAASWSVSHLQLHPSARTAALPVPRSSTPVSHVTQAVSEVGSSTTVAENSTSHRPEVDNASTSTANTARNGGSPSMGIRTPDPTH
ncbi:MAG: hypothetical protein JWN86_3771 [Planctomycetota bacterium]|nr:hypothetical protein [Planctomycetota bacterium]